MAIRSKEQGYVEKNIYLIPGEKIIKSSMLISYFMSLTNYRLYLICKNSDVDRIPNKCCHIGIPINLILKIEQVDFKLLCLYTKIGSVYKLSFDCNENCSNWLKILSENLVLKNTKKLFAFKFFKYIQKSKSGWLIKSKNGTLNKSMATDIHLIKDEFKRMQFLKESWKITHVNHNFQICNSYPRYHIVPNSITDDDIKEMSDFRGNKRFPSVVWRSQINGAVIIRCAQPQVGLMFWRNSSDETFFKEILNCLKNSDNTKRLLIIDARHYSTAQLNRIRGGGVEYSEYYGEAEIMFMQLENIHSVRSSFDCISTFSMNGENWLTSIENSYWLKYLSKLLKSASDIAKALNDDGRSVIIHCSDGWDRTPQLTSLSQILLDGYYRTIEGFKILIEREWIQFGHKFSERCGFYKSIDNKERSPIFVQWLDCIHQLIRQYPCDFEFNETFLIKLALHVHSGLFGTFLFNTEEERQKNEVYNSTVSIWDFFSVINEDVINPLYYKFSSNITNHEFYNKVIYPKHNTKFLFPWNRLFFEALNPPDIYKIFSLDHSSRSLNIFLNNKNEEFLEDDIINHSLSNQTCLLRKSKSDSNLSVKCKTLFELSDKTCLDSPSSNYINIDNDITRCNGRFINQASSTLFLNEITTNGILNDNHSSHLNIDDDQKISRKNKFQRIELMAYSFNNHNDNSTLNCDKRKETKTISNESENLTHQSVNKFKKDRQNNQYFRIKNLTDSKEFGIGRDNVPCDLDGLYKSVEPINILNKVWQDKFEEQQSMINQLKEKLFLETDMSTKIRYESTSSVERPRNEDSLSSYDSYIMLDPSDSIHNIYSENSRMEINHNISPIQNTSLIHGNILHQCNYNKSLFNQQFIRSSVCNQSSYFPCETGNGTEKAQA